MDNVSEIRGIELKNGMCGYDSGLTPLQAGVPHPEGNAKRLTGCLYFLTILFLILFNIVVIIEGL
jgi:hypothetical protein